MNKKYTKDKESRINILSSKRLHKEYKILCIENEYNMSERIRQFMEKDIEEHKNKK